MSKTYKELLDYYSNATKKQVIEDLMLDNLEIERLNNIINRYDIFLKHELIFEGHSVEWIENKLKEFKGDFICH